MITEPILDIHKGTKESILVRHSSGVKNPEISIPLNSCDCHHHIYDPARYPYHPNDSRNQPEATVANYRLLQKRLRLQRNVVVTPSAYGIDNRCTLDALRQFGSQARAVVVVNPSISNHELEEMNTLGVRGVRFNLAAGPYPMNENRISQVVERIQAWDWHAQFWMSANDTVELEPLLNKLPVRLVFDHFGHLPQPAGTLHPAYKVICKLIDKGSAWVKLSGFYHDSLDGEPKYSDIVTTGRAYVEFAPQRMLFGSDWPHPSEHSAGRRMPDDALLIDLLGDITSQNQSMLRQILVANPEILYGF
ncbi:amidohydrolase family protein [Paenibacillus camerounensis]|uniref:amidohydrolase family protein n=1 Tax=Paenibacillus camerounensis TaxID=1243663 RepID=UPI000693356A|nr:amidohydrolase family protein [Paenibacillus camerounensis]